MSPTYSRSSASPQRGVILVELMTGLTVGLLVTTAALGTLAFLAADASRQSAAFRMQQRVDIAMETIGAQLRQAGTIELEPGSDGESVSFSTAFTSLAVSGTEGANGSPDTLRVSHQHAPGVRDCLGNEIDPSQGGTEVNSNFRVTAGSLRCLGTSTSTGSQVIADQVEDFQVVYGIRTPSALGLQFRDESADTIGTRWGEVRVVRVCLQVVGEQRRSAAVRSAQRDCQGRPLPSDGRVRRVAHASFSLRNAAL